MLCTVMLAGMSGTPLAQGPSGWCVCMTAKSLLQETHALHATIRHIFNFLLMSGKLIFAYANNLNSSLMSDVRPT